MHGSRQTFLFINPSELVDGRHITLVNLPLSIQQLNQPPDNIPMICCPIFWPEQTLTLECLYIYIYIPNKATGLP